MEASGTVFREKVKDKQKKPCPREGTRLLNEMRFCYLMNSPAMESGTVHFSELYLMNSIFLMLPKFFPLTDVASS